ncbi:MAG: protein translocase subunit SecF [Candidatus Woesebacteria bacterium]|jgi:preprotein translocase subunit SecF
MNLMRFKKFYFAVSLFFLIPGILSLIFFGLKPSIDFTGGSLLELRLKSNDEIILKQEELENKLNEIYTISSVQRSGFNQFILRGKAIKQEQKEQVLTKIVESYAELEEIRFETVGPTLGKELLVKTLAAVLILSIFITIYVWRQFDELKFGLSAILAMFHDSLILLGSFSLLGYFFKVEVDVLFVTAVLTTLSFSIHDTIVVFDRIRELRKRHHKENLETIANVAVLETLARSINNSVTIILMLLALVILGGETIRWFAIALLIGAITGTYSSTFTAVPILLSWDELKNKKKM